tara:strand:- start:1218 stop:1538 length:321 start_codon:yes stop_codon:yes gene_type:complete
MGEFIFPTHHMDDFRLPFFPPGRLVKCSIKVSDLEDWGFMDPDTLNFERSPDGTEFIQFNAEFGILSEDEEDPMEVAKLGKRLDYLIREADGTLNIVDQDVWDKLL